MISSGNWRRAGPRAPSHCPLGLPAAHWACGDALPGIWLQALKGHGDTSGETPLHWARPTAEVASQPTRRKQRFLTKFTHALMTVASGASLLALTACSSADEPSTPTSPAEALATPDPTPTAASPAPTASAEVVASTPLDLTEPGTELPVSEDFTVTLRESWWNSDTESSDTREIPATYSFDGIREGAASDLSDVLGDDELATIESHSLYYVDYTVTLDNGPFENPVSGVSEVTDLDAVDTAGGGDLGSFIFFDGGPDICAYPDTVALADTGSTSACQIVMVESGESIDRLEFEGANPVTWLVD